MDDDTIQYAKWCLMLINGEDFIVDEILSKLRDDRLIDESDEWLGDDE